MLKGSTNSYFIRDRDMVLLAYCLVKGKCITHPTIFRSTPEAEQPWFRMEAERKVLNRTYYLFDHSDVKPFATITQKGRGLWRVLDDSDRERCVFVDSSTSGEKAADIILGGSPDRYAVTTGDRIWARIRMEPRPEEKPTSHDQGFLKRILKRITRRSEWVLALEPETTGLDHRTLLAGMILLIEHTIAGHRSD